MRTQGKPKTATEVILKYRSSLLPRKCSCKVVMIENEVPVTPKLAHVSMEIQHCSIHAAAPELLEHLKRICSLCLQGEPEVISAQDLIARAEGRQGG